MVFNWLTNTHWWLSMCCVIQFSSVVQTCLTLCNPMDCSTPGFPVHYQLLELAQTHVHWISDPIQPSHPLSSLSPPLLASIFPSIRVFSNESVFHLRWPKYWSFSLSISPGFNEYSGLVSFRIDCFDLLAVQDSQESSPTSQFKSINSLVLSFCYSPVLTSVHDYWKNHSFNRQTFVDKVMSLFFNMLSRLVIVFLPRSKRRLISWLQSPSAVTLEPKKIKSVTDVFFGILLLFLWSNSCWQFDLWFLCFF